MTNEIIQKWKLSSIQKLSISDTVDFVNESDDLRFTEDSGRFRYSYDDKLYTDWKELSELGDKTFNNKKPNLYLEFKFTLDNPNDVNINALIPEERPNYELGLKDESDEIVDEVCKIPNIYTESNCKASLVYCDSDDNKNLFNPYDVGSMSSIYNELSSVVNNTFGFLVRYFKTEPNTNTKDYILHEYSLKNVVDAQDLKVLVNDNQLPTNDFQVNTLMINYPETFEVHIVKSKFKELFGENAIPQENDYLWFQQANFNRVYEVSSVRNPDTYIYEASYWRVLLTPYQKRASVEYGDDELGQSLLDETNLLIIDEKKKKVEVEEVMEDFMEHRDKQQLTDPEYNQRTRSDAVKPGRGAGIKTVETVVYHRSVPVIKSYYDFSSAMPITTTNADGTHCDDEAVLTYHYTKPYDFSEKEYTIMFWIKPMSLVQTPTLVMGMSGVDIELCCRSITINGNTMGFGAETLSKNNWYLFVVSLNDGIGCYWCYELVSPKSGPISIKNKYLTLFNGNTEKSATGQFEFEYDETTNNGKYSLYNGKYYITNIRLFNLIVDTDRHISTGCQYMVQESGNLLIGDNAENLLENQYHKTTPNP